MSEHITDEERARMGMQVDLMIDLISKRYGLQPTEVIDAVRWVQTHREFVSRVKNGGLLSLFAVLISASLLTAWEGFKALMRGDK